MKYYSEQLEKFYDSEADLIEAEKSELEKKHLAEVSRKELAKKVEAADKRIELAYENYEKVKKEAFFEIILMTYSYVHTRINEEAFPNAINLYNKDLMTGRGNGKYGYKEGVRIEVEKYLREEMKKYFPSNRIVYIV